MDTILYDPNTGRRLNPGETVIDNATGRSLTQGQSFSAINNPPPRNETNYDQLANDNPNALNDTSGFNSQQPGESTEQYKARLLSSPFDLAGSSTSVRAVPEPIIQEGLYKGLTQRQANAKKQEQGEQDSSLTSYSFNPESISKTKSAVDRFNLSLDEIKNYPFDSVGTINEKKNSTLNLTASDIAKSFTDPQLFYTTYQNNAELQQTLKPFIDNGGSLSQIASKINTSPITDNAPQDTASYLESLNNKSNFDVNDPFQLKAMEALSPENELAQKEIMRIGNIAQEYKDLYFGTPEQLGVLAEQKAINEEKKKLLETKALNDKATATEKANYQIEKNKADADIMKAEIEENRLKSKNYMTGMLAKLGALQTTGNAPLALATLDQKYQQQKQQLESKLSFANRGIEIDLTEKINNITEVTADNILNLREDLSKSYEDVQKEIFKLQNDAQSKIYTMTDKAAQEFRKTTDQFRKDAMSITDKYNANFLSLASKGINVKSIPGLIDKATGRVDTSKLTNAMFAPKTGAGTGESNFTAQELRKLEQAGINPKTDRQGALNFLYGGEGSSSKLPTPEYKNNTLNFGSKESKVTKNIQTLMTDTGILNSDIIGIQNLLGQGYSLKQVATITGMPAKVFNEFNKYIVTE